MQLYEKILKAKAILQTSEEARLLEDRTFLQNDQDIVRILRTNSNQIAALNEKLDQLANEEMKSELDRLFQELSKKYGRPYI